MASKGDHCYTIYLQLAWLPETSDFFQTKIFSVQGPLGGICIEWNDFCFQRRKFYKLCFTFISA